MSHYEERLQSDLDEIRSRVRKLGAGVNAAIENAANALIRRDGDLAASVILGDLPINRGTREVDRLCHLVVARHLPSAGNLRFVSSTMRLMVALERVGDYAVTIAREAVQLSADAPERLRRDIEAMADRSRATLRQSLQAYDEGSADLARGAKSLTGEKRSAFHGVFTDLLDEAERSDRSMKDLFALLIVINRLERIGDQAKNICEETIFAATGETKAPKVYRVLFVDRTNTLKSVMAAAIAKRAYANSGSFESAGWQPGSEREAAVTAFLDQHGLASDADAPRELVPTHEVLNDYHVVVALEDGLIPRIAEIPFHTVIVHWEVGPGPAAAADLTAADVVTAVHRDLTVRIRDLMETLRGPEPA